MDHFKTWNGDLLKHLEDLRLVLQTGLFRRRLSKASSSKTPPNLSLKKLSNEDSMLKPKLSTSRGPTLNKKIDFSTKSFLVPSLKSILKHSRPKLTSHQTSSNDMISSNRQTGFARGASTDSAAAFYTSTYSKHPNVDRQSSMSNKFMRKYVKAAVKQP